MRRTLLIPLAVSLSGAPIYAHHSFATDYVETEMVSIEGNVVQFDYKNPHSIMVVAVADERGQLQTFTLEFGGINRLKRDGITPETFKVGDRLVLRGSPGRRPQERRIHLKGIHRPTDGWSWGRQG
jgi:hypothetical protein